VPAGPHAVQLRTQLLAARVRKALFACLVFINLLPALLGVLLTAAAPVSLWRDLGDVQARISIAALVAAF